MGDLLDRYELAVYAYLDMAEDRYRTGQDRGTAVRWELHAAAEDLRAAGIREHELDELQAEAVVKLRVLRRLYGSARGVALLATTGRPLF
jgi:hypothetical protein